MTIFQIVAQHRLSSGCCILARIVAQLTEDEKRLFRSLKWKNQCGYESASHGTCLYFRETRFSKIAGFIFGSVLCVAGVVCGTMMLLETDKSGSWFGIVAIVIGLLFGVLMFVTLRKGPWFIVYDRGSNGDGHIRTQDKTIPLSSIHSMGAQQIGGNPPQSMVIARLHDGKTETIGPSGTSTWPAHWAHMAAEWMGVAYY